MLAGQNLVAGQESQANLQYLLECWASTDATVSKHCLEFGKHPKKGLYHDREREQRRCCLAPNRTPSWLAAKRRQRPAKAKARDRATRKTKTAETLDLAAAW